MSKKSTKLEALHDLFEENNIQIHLIEGNDVLINAFKKNAETIPDYRHPSYVRHPLTSIVMIVFFAVLANADEWAEIETFAKKERKMAVGTLGSSVWNPNRRYIPPRYGQHSYRAVFPSHYEAFDRISEQHAVLCRKRRTGSV